MNQENRPDYLAGLFRLDRSAWMHNRVERYAQMVEIAWMSPTTAKLFAEAIARDTPHGFVSKVRLSTNIAAVAFYAEHHAEEPNVTAIETFYVEFGTGEVSKTGDLGGRMQWSF